MTSILKDFWHGNIVPCSDSKSATQEMQDLSEYICRHRESLLKALSDEQKENLKIAKKNVPSSLKKQYLNMVSDLECRLLLKRFPTKNKSNFYN